MYIITAQEFGKNQQKYLELAEKETVLVTRNGNKTISLSAIDDENELSPDDMQSLLRGLEDIHNGNTFAMKDDETLDEFLKRIEKCIE